MTENKIVSLAFLKDLSLVYYSYSLQLNSVKNRLCLSGFVLVRYLEFIS